MAEEIIFDVELNIAAYNRNLEAALQTARRFDSELNAIFKTAKGIDKKLAELNRKVKVTVQADASSVDRAEGKVKALDGASPKVEIQADSSALDRAEGKVDELDGSTPEVQVQADTSALDRAEGKVDAIDGATPEVEVQADNSALDRTEGKIAGIDGSSPRVEPTVDTSSIDRLEQRLGAISGKLNISLALQGVNTLRDSGVGGLPLVGGIQDQQAAGRLLEARGGGGAAGIEAVNAAYEQGFGSSRVELAGMTAQLTQANVGAEDLSSSLLAVMQVATVQGRDAQEIFSAMDRLVSSGLADSFADAGDILTVGFQNGADRAGDFLDTIREYSGQFSEANLSAEQFIGFLTSGLEAGAFNTDKLADTVKESFSIRLNEGLTDPESAPGQVLARLFSPEEIGAFTEQKEAGTLSADAYLEALIARVQEKGSSFDLFELLGSGAEDLTSGLVTGFDFTALPVQEGAAAQSSSAFLDTIGTDITTLMRTLENGFLESFEVAGEGFSTFIDGAQAKLKVLTDELRSGTALPEALEIALEAPGLADKIRDFEASVGNFIIELQLVVAGVLDFLGRGAEAEGIRTAVRDQSANQLQYELVFSNEQEDVTAAIKRAVDRGVTESAILDVIQQAADELLSEDKIARAEALIGRIETALPTVAKPGAQGPDITDPLGLFGAGQAQAQKLGLIPVDNFFTAEDPIGPIRDQITEAAEAVTEGASDMQAALDAAFAGESGTGSPIDAFGTLGFAIQTAGAISVEEGPRIGGLSVPLDQIWESNLRLVDSLNAMNTDATPALEGLAAAYDAQMPVLFAYLDELEQKYLDAGQAAYDLWSSTGGGTVPGPTPPPGRASGGPVAAGSPYLVGEGGPELFVPGMSGSIIPDGLTQFLLSMAGGGSSSTVINVNTVVNTSGNAQASMAGDRLARSIRGY